MGQALGPACCSEAQAELFEDEVILPSEANKDIGWSEEAKKWREKLAGTRQKFANISADHKGSVLLTSDGLSNGYLKNAFLMLLGRESIPTDMKALVLMDSSRFRSETKESFTENLVSLGWPEENIDSLNLIDKGFIPSADKEKYA